MDEQKPMSGGELGDALAEIVRPVVAAFQQLGEAFTRAMTGYWSSPAGQQMRAVLEYYERHPELLEAMIAAREAEAARRYCDCMCGRWGHRGACTTIAEVDRMFFLDGESVVVPLCRPCATSIDAQHPAVPGGVVVRE